MKSILITGAGSYIGVSLENDLKQWPESYRVDSLDMRGSDWESHSLPRLRRGVPRGGAGASAGQQK